MEPWTQAQWTQWGTYAGEVTGPKSSDTYFAFVESLDRFSSFEQISNPPEWLTWLKSDRGDSPAANTQWVAWLDCIEADYFVELDWREIPWDSNDEEETLTRRRQILEMPKKNFRVAVMLLDEKDPREGDMRTQFAEAAWHRVTLGNRIPGVPAVAAEDFDLRGAVREQVAYFGRCGEIERASLLKVFNFDFIKDADLDQDDRRGPGPGNKPKPPDLIRLVRKNVRDREQGRYRER